jgi:integrase
LIRCRSRSRSCLCRKDRRRSTTSPSTSDLSTPRARRAHSPDRPSGGEAGLRYGEMIALEWGDVDLVNRQVCIRRSDWNGHVTVPKGGRLRHVPLTRRLARALRDHRHLRSSRVLCQDDREPLTRRMVQSRVRRASRRAGLAHDGYTSCVTPSARISRCEGRPRGQFRNWPATRNSMTQRVHAPQSSRARRRDQTPGRASECSWFWRHVGDRRVRSKGRSMARTS